jgi:hypothetical protein
LQEYFWLFWVLDEKCIEGYKMVHELKSESLMERFISLSYDFKPRRAKTLNNSEEFRTV